MLFINDGSKDNGLKLVEEICKRNKDFYYISLVKNTGLSGAIKAGFDNCHSKYCGYIDADLQTTPEDFNLLLPHVEEYPLVMGIRANRKDSGFKNLQSKIANNFRRFMTKDEAIDTVMEKEKRKQTNLLSISMASDPLLTMKPKCSVYKLPKSS